MRFFDLSASAIAAAALLHGAVASPAEQPQGYGPAPTTSATATTTYYTTMTVFRVATTVTATRNASTITTAYTSSETSAVVVPTTLASVSIPVYGNSTNVSSTGAMPSSTGIIPSIGGASGLQACSMAVAAVAGMAGLLLV